MSYQSGEVVAAFALTSPDRLLERGDDEEVLILSVPYGLAQVSSCNTALAAGYGPG